MKLHKNNLKIYAAIAVFGLIASCKPTIDIDTPNEKGKQVDFSKFIAVGNSLTAGFANGGLYLEGQKNSFPNMLAEQMKQFGGGEFLTPYFPEDQFNGSGYLRLKALVNGQPVMEEVKTDLAVRGLNSENKPLYTKYTDPINNLGIPGMRLDMSTSFGLGTTLGNPYFERLLPDNAPPTTTYLSYATSHDHTFFSFSLGNNDVLGYATNGAATTNDPTKTLVSEAVFQEKYQEFIDKLTLKQQKGVVATIPDVTAVPFFTTVTTKALLAAASAAAGVPIEALYIETKAGPKKATDNDLFVLPFSSAGLLGVPNDLGIPYGFSPYNPIGDQFVLDQQEVLEVQERIKKLNSIIKTIASDKGLAVADIYAFLNKVKEGYNYNGITISNKFITGNVFSLDGIHLTPMGYAIMANIFIDSINSKYGSALGKINVAKYDGVLIP